MTISFDESIGLNEQYYDDLRIITQELPSGIIGGGWYDGPTYRFFFKTGTDVDFTTLPTRSRTGLNIEYEFRPGGRF